MKVLYITPHLSTGGAPRYLLEKIRLLNDLCDIYCIEYTDITGGVLIVQKSEIQKLLGNKLITIGENKNDIIKEINRIAPNVVHFEEMPEYFCDYEVARQIYNPNRTYKIFETSHDSSFNAKNKLFFPDKFLLISEYQRRLFESIDVPSEIVEFPITYKKKSDRASALRKLNLDPNYVHIINVGLFTPRKNQKELIEYARKLVNLPVQFHFIGSLADNFKFYWEEAIKDLPSNCIIWGERADVDNFYDAADLFFFASRGFENDKETSPLVIRECIGWNVPIFLYNLPVYCDMYNKYDNMMFLSLDKDINLNNLKEKITSVYNEQVRKHIDPSYFTVDFTGEENKFWVWCRGSSDSLPEMKLHTVYKDVDSLTTFYSVRNSSFNNGSGIWVLPMDSYKFYKDENFRGFIVEFYDLNYKLLFTKEFFIKNSAKNPDKIEFSLLNPFDRTFWNYQEMFVYKNIEKQFPTLDFQNLNLVLDIGANNGVFIEKMLLAGAKKVYGFEPNPNALSNLNYRYGSNTKVKIVDKAVSDTNGKCQFFYHPDNSTISAFNKNHISFHLPEKEIINFDVETVKLDSFCNAENIDFIDLIKVDVEGAEYMILHSLDLNFYRNVKYLLIETHENTNDKVKNLISYLRNFGFEINSFAIHDEICLENDLLNSPNGMFLATNKRFLKNIVTVVIPTYNHEKYIEQCVDSVLMQKTNFNFDILISNDCSSDSTKSVLEKYKNINNVRIINEEVNRGATLKRFNSLLSLCKTKYVTFLDGDDYYLSTDKLQLQVDFLEKNDSYVLHSPCYKFSNADYTCHSLINELTFEQNVFANYVSCGVMYRNDILQKNFTSLNNYDCDEIFDPYWIYPLLLLNYGNGYNEQNTNPTVVYRLHNTSEFSHLEEQKKRKLVFKQGKKLGQIHDAKILHHILKMRRSEDILDFYTEIGQASFEGYVDVFDLSSNKKIIDKKKISFSAFMIEGQEMNLKALDYKWASINIPINTAIKIDFFDRNNNFILTKTDKPIKAALVTDVFFHGECNYSNFIEYANNMKKTDLPLLLMTNSKFDDKILDYVDYLIYDKEDRLFKHNYSHYKPLILFSANDKHVFRSPTEGKQKHGLSVISNIYRSLIYLKSLNYTHIVKTEADCLLENPEKINDELLNIVNSNKKGLIYLHNDNGDLFTSCHVLYFDIDFLLSLYPQINSEKDYQNFIGYDKFISAEEFLTKVAEPKIDQIIVKDSNLIFTDFGKNSLWNRILSPLESDKLINGCIPNIFRVYVNDVLQENVFAIALINMNNTNNNCEFIVKLNGVETKYDFSVNDLIAYQFEIIKFDKNPTTVTIVKDNFIKTVEVVNIMDIDNTLCIKE